jgi:ABC-type lipoprotein export system ATPase subunit
MIVGLVVAISLTAINRKHSVNFRLPQIQKLLELVMTLLTGTIRLSLTQTIKPMIIQLQNISKHYQIPGSENRRTILDDISLTINKGEMLGIVGPSGSGKSTLLNIAGTLDKPDSGQVLIGEANTSGLNDEQLSKLRNQHIGFVFQLHHLLPQLTLLENVLLPLIPHHNQTLKKTATDRARELLKIVGLQDKSTQKPGQLSVGECQRTAIVRALINEPDILLADEPTGALDQKSAQDLADLLLKINEEKQVSMVVVTHAEKLARQIKKVYTLENGKLKG